MIALRKLSEDGLRKFRDWLVSPDGKEPPRELIAGETETEVVGSWEIDQSKIFTSRYELGVYLNELFANSNFADLTSSTNDGVWSWLAVIYFDQLTAKGIRRAEHYVVSRHGSAGSLAYRHSVKTPYELVHIHQDAAIICLRSPMHTFGDMTEQLASRQTIAHNRGFFRTAYELYVKDGRLKRGAASKPKKPKDRKLGDRTGFGSIRRLAIALQRLDLTYDTEQLDSNGLISVLPKEFSKWKDASDNPLT